MKKIYFLLVMLAIFIGFFQIMRSTSHVYQGPNCWGGYECGNPGDAGASCGKDKNQCECQVQIFVGTVCKAKLVQN